MSCCGTILIGLAVLPGLLPSPLLAGSRTLMTLRRVSGSYPSVALPLHYGSAVFANYDDSEAWQGAWTVGLRYRNCSVTPSGAIRLTVYRMAGSHDAQVYMARLPRGAVQYAYPVIDRKTSDTPVWQFDAVPKGTYYYKVEVLGHRVCGSWGVAATTN